MTEVRTFESSPLAPYDRGFELGERLSALVATSASTYRRLFAARAEGPFDVDLWSERAWAVISERSPTAADEIAGIADGARRPVREIAAINARTELLAVANPSGMVSECSTVVSLAPGRPPVAVQTWDWYDLMSDNWLHWTIPHPDGRRVETVTEVGMLGKIGVNGYGVGVMLNMLHHTSDRSAEPEPELSYPVHLLSRRIMDEATSFEDAVTIATSSPMSASTSLTVVAGDDGGSAASVELFPDGHGLLEPTEGLLVRTNHFVSAEGAPGCTAARIGPGTRIRRDKLLAAFAGSLPDSTKEVVTAMDDHASIGGICVHADRSLPEEYWHATLATVSVDTEGCRLDVSADGPCAR